VGVRVLATNGQEDLANVDTSDGSVRFAPGTSHTGLQSISTSTRQHLVDTDDVEGVDSDSQMESILSGGLGDVLVCADTSSFKSFA